MRPLAPKSATLENLFGKLALTVNVVFSTSGACGAMMGSMQKVINTIALAILLGACSSDGGPLPDAALPVDVPDTSVDLECTTSPAWPSLVSDCGTGPAAHYVDSVRWWAIKNAHENTRIYLERCGVDDAAVSVCGEAPALASLPMGETPNEDITVSCSEWLSFVASTDAVRAWSRCVVDHCPGGICQ